MQKFTVDTYSYRNLQLYVEFFIWPKGQRVTCVCSTVQ